MLTTENSGELYRRVYADEPADRPIMFRHVLDRKLAAVFGFMNDEPDPAAGVPVFFCQLVVVDPVKLVADGLIFHTGRKAFQAGHVEPGALEFTVQQQGLFLADGFNDEALALGNFLERFIQGVVIHHPPPMNRSGRSG